MNRKEKTGAKIAILGSSACSLSYMAFSPVIASIAAAFPETDISLVQMTVTLPSLMFIVFSPLAGKLTQYIPKKVLLETALVCYFFGGILPFFLHQSIWLILLCSLVIGCGGGILMPLLNALICDYFDMEERARIMGLNATATALGALLFIFVGGQLAARFGWAYCFLAFLLVVPILVISVIFLPDDRQAGPDEAQKGSGFEMNPYIAALFVIGFVYFVFQNGFNTNSSLYVSETGLGDAGTASLVSMANTAGGIVGGVLFGAAVRRLKDQTGSLTIAAAGIGFLLSFFFRTFFPILLGSALVGIAFAFYNATGTYLLSKYLKPENNAFTVSIYLAVVNFGASISPIVVNTISGSFSHQIASRFLLCGIVLLACAAVSLLVNKLHVQKLHLGDLVDSERSKK